jgi:hypothetical protein
MQVECLNNAVSSRHIKNAIDNEWARRQSVWYLAKLQYAARNQVCDRIRIYPGKFRVAFIPLCSAVMRPLGRGWLWCDCLCCG